MLAFKDFPKAVDIIAIARIESSYNEKARNGISHGVMQVNKGPWELSANMQAGVRLLRGYYEQLKSPKAAVTAYNIGIGNYTRGKRNPAYWSKFQGAKNEVNSLGSVLFSSNWTDDLPTGYLSGYPGSILLQSNGTTHDDQVLERGSSEDNFKYYPAGEVRENLGKVNEVIECGFSLYSSSDP